jgi:hypothetical protein
LKELERNFRSDFGSWVISPWGTWVMLSGGLNYNEPRGAAPRFVAFSLTQFGVVTATGADAGDTFPIVSVSVIA